MGTDVYGAAVATAGGFVYAVSGFSFSIGGYVNQVRRYDPATNTWIGLTPVPTAAETGSLAYDAAGGRLFFGGSNLGGPLNLAQVYNIAANTWSPGPTMPAVRRQMGSGVIGGMIYLVGGFSSTTISPVTVPGSAALSGAPSCSGDIIIAGGGNPTLGNEASPGVSRAIQTTNVTQLYNVATNSWSAGPSLPTGRSFLGAAQAGNTLITVGGYTGATSVSTVDRIQGPPLPVELQSISVE